MAILNLENLGGPDIPNHLAAILVSGTSGWLKDFSMPSAASMPNLVLVDKLAQKMGCKALTTVKTAFLDSGHIGIGGLRGPDAPGHKY